MNLFPSDGIRYLPIATISRLATWQGPENCRLHAVRQRSSKWRIRRMHKNLTHTPARRPMGHKQENLRGQFGKTDHQQSLTLKAWKSLQAASTHSMFIVSGTPFVTKISYDFIAMTIAVAKEEVRTTWSPKATAEICLTYVYFCGRCQLGGN